MTDLGPRRTVLSERQHVSLAARRKLGIHSLDRGIAVSWAPVEGTIWLTRRSSVGQAGSAAAAPYETGLPGRRRRTLLIFRAAGGTRLPYDTSRPLSPVPDDRNATREQSRHARPSRGWSCPFAAAAQGVVDVKIVALLRATSGSQIDTAVAAVDTASAGFSEVVVRW
jgi:hypothetical protein